MMFSYEDIITEYILEYEEGKGCDFIYGIRSANSAAISTNIKPSTSFQGNGTFLNECVCSHIRVNYLCYE